MSTYKNFALIGAGTLGEAVVKALVENNANVIVLIRPGSATKTLPERVKQIHVSTADVDAVTATFLEHKIEVVIAAVTAQAMLAQIPLADAAKKAGVKLFVPSEFGFAPLDVPKGPLADKEHVAAYLKEVGIPTTRIFVGMFSQFYPWLVQYRDGKIHIIGSGDRKVTFTDVNDIAGFTAYVTTHLQPSKLENKSFRIQGETMTLREVAALYGETAEIVNSEKLGDPFPEQVQREVVDLGKGSTGYDVRLGREGEGENAAGSANALWVGHRWLTRA